jgi:hypothetical protein
MQHKECGESMNKKGTVSNVPLIVAYIVFVGTLIVLYHFRLDIPQTVQIINKPWSLSEKIILSISIIPVLLVTLSYPIAYAEEKHTEKIVQKYTKGIQISILETAELSTGNKRCHCHIKSDKIDTDCKIIFYKDSEFIKSVIFPKEWREKNQRIYKYRYQIADIIGDKVKADIKASIS